MFAQCPVWWRGDDFTRCALRDILQTLLPLISCALSVFVFAYAVFARSRRKDAAKGFTATKNNAQNGNGYMSQEDLEEEDSIPSTESDESDQEEQWTVRPPLIHSTSVITIDRPRGQNVVALVEELAVLGELGAQLASFMLHAWGEAGKVSSIANVAVWAYISTLTTIRFSSGISSKLMLPGVWYHTATLYGVQWIISIIALRSELIHPNSRLAQALSSTSFGITTFLFLIALSSRRGNRTIKLEKEGDLEPAREPLASVLSLASFSWVDSLVVTGWKKDLELSDIWNLPPEDQAAKVLFTYRQVKKANSLAWHLVKFFKKTFLIQAFWSVISGILTFVPTLLLKMILEYIEDPLSRPRNVAWLNVALLFVSGLTNALSNGQALWNGRKICIRLRAIIIGEIYAKALRRRVGAAPDKVLGARTSKHQAEDGAKQSFWGKLFGRKKQKSSADSGSDTTAVEPVGGESQVTSGAIINLMAVDSFKVAEVSSYIHFLWAETPVQFVLAIVLLFRILGASSVAGLAMMALLLPVNMIVAKKFTQVQTKILAATDARIHTTNEVLTNIRIIKYFAWEQRFLALIDEKRLVELRHLRNRYILWALAATVWQGAPILITFLSFLFYTVVEKKALTPSIAFTALSLFGLLRVPLDQLADMVAHVQESKVSIDRVEEYLNEPETDKYQQLKGDDFDDEGEHLIGFDNATFSWGSRGEDVFKMIELDIRFKPSQLNVIIGPTGSGKTSMLMALLGEMTLLAGKVYLPGAKSRETLKPDPNTGLVESVAYCAQQAWLVNGTIKENIVFASPWNAKRYKQTIVACSLQRDLEILDAGDNTLVGEKGVTLSGGQKQRISLARALYSTARHILLDDVLSAVDSHTAKWIFDKALMGPLMYNRTCVLVTHNAVLCLPHAEYAVVLDNGRVTAQGRPAEVIASGTLAEDFSNHVLENPNYSVSSLPSRVPSHVGGDAPMDEAVGRAEATESNNNLVDIHEQDTLASTDAPPTSDALAKVISKDIPGLNKSMTNDIQHEGKATGAVKYRVILDYFGYMGGVIFWIFMVLLFFLQQASQVSTNVWIREWANAYTREEVISTDAHELSPITYVRTGFGSPYNCIMTGSCMWNFPMSKHWMIASFEHSYEKINVGYYLGVYALLGFLYITINLARDALIFAGGLWAARRMHRKLVESVARAKFRFFDTTPLGQIMNRFSKDVEAIDQEVAPSALGMVHCLGAIITIVLLISVIIPQFLIAGFFISILYFLIGAFFIRSSRDLKRLESVQRSPLYQQFGETLSGMTTIRAYGDERRFIRDNLLRINTHSRPFIYLWATNRWLAFRVDMVGALVAFFTGVFVLLGAGRVDAGAAGLALTYAVTFTENVLWFVRLYAANEQNMNAVERVKEYLDVDQEAPAIVPDNRPEADWPSKGSVEFIGYSTKYRPEFEYVLKNLTFKILPGEKVGVVGRTGAGKSSLALALFRALEAYDGKILVDDIDIGLIGLQDLRENIVMVPQDPTLFTGTIRSNLDPFGLFTDEEIFETLRSVQLIGAATSTPSRPATPASPVPELTANQSDTKAVYSPKLPSATASSSSNQPPDTPVLENKNIFRNLSSAVAESGSNLSQGQRQLLCLARAMLKNPKVLLMDEATASIDYATDAKIQETIRGIKNTTITVAHRLQTIIDYDKVLVLDVGEVVEYGDPFDLLKKEGGLFRAMCDMTGDFELLEREAKKAHDSRRLVDDD